MREPTRSTGWAPWYVIPAAHKKLTQALVALSFVDAGQTPSTELPEGSAKETRRISRRARSSRRAVAPLSCDAG